jgi:D-alanyl-D-alanine carboxypeptidase (penicillin-binding protein 5/6)
MAHPPTTPLRAGASGGSVRVMKTHTTRPWWRKTRSTPGHRDFLAAFLLVAALLWMANWGCSLVAQPDSKVEAGFRPAARVAKPNGAAIPPGAPEVHARSAIVIDAVTGESLYEKDADRPLAVASTQKLLTALQAIDEGQLSRRVTVSLRDALQPPTRIGLAAGSVHRRIDLLAGMLISSANDAASALATNGRGSYGWFMQSMNDKARSLGATNSLFLNPHGLDAPGQYSTARDSAIIAYHAYRDPLIRHYVARQSYWFPVGDGYGLPLGNTNELLWNWPPYFNGLKGGFTYQGGKCLIASAKRNGSEIIIVLLGSTQERIFRDAKNLFHWHQQRLRNGAGG